MTRILGILAVGGGSQSAEPPGGWGTALIVMGTLRPQGNPVERSYA